MRRRKFPNDSLDDQELAALWEVIKGKTINEAASTLKSEFNISDSQAKRRRRTAFETLNTDKETVAVLKAVLSGLVPIVDVARYYGIPLCQLREQLSLGRAVSRTNLDGIAPLLPQVDISNPYKVNNWLLEQVVTRTPRPPKWDPEKLYTTFSHMVTKARTNSITYPAHPLALNTHVGRPLDGYYYPSVSIDYDNAYIDETYLRDGPRALLMPHLAVETLANEISTEIAKPIFAQDDATAALGRVVLENRTQYEQGFHDLVKKWCCLEIYPLTAVERLVKSGTNAKDDWLYYLGANVLTPDHVEEWLKEQVKYLTWHDDNFHIALLDDINHPDNVLTKFIKPDFWAVKVCDTGQNALFWEDWPVDSQGRKREVDRRVSEHDVIKAFIEIIGYVWQCMPDDVLIRDRTAVIKRLKDQYKKLKPGKV